MAVSRYAPAARRHPYRTWTPDAQAQVLLGEKWTLLIIGCLAGGPMRFVEIQRSVHRISTEQLRSRLNRMVDEDLLTRQRYREVPPRVDYELTDRARAAFPIIRAFFTWGLRHVWEAPKLGQVVDVGAFLRMAPILLDHMTPMGQRSVTILAGVDDRTWMIELHPGGRIDVVPNPVVPESGCDVEIAGAELAWIEALTPGGHGRGLHVHGRRPNLAGDVVAALAGRPHVDEEAVAA